MKIRSVPELYQELVEMLAQVSPEQRPVSIQGWNLSCNVVEEHVLPALEAELQETRNKLLAARKLILDYNQGLL